MKNILIIGIVAAGLLGGMWWWRVSPIINDETVIATSGIHWHPHIEILVKGVPQEIPGNIGIGLQYASAPLFDARMGMVPMHTHEADGIIHLEFPGRVTKEDIKLGNFLSMWGKDFGSPVKMTVNGQETNAWGEYEMKDGDTIVLKYE